MPDAPFDADNQTKTDTLRALRTQISELLPRAMQYAIASYRRFSAQLTSDEPKQFIAHHNACRSALSHVDALSKLTRWITQSQPQDDDMQNLQPLLQQARHLLIHNDEFNPDSDNDDDTTTHEF